MLMACAVIEIETQKYEQLSWIPVAEQPFWLNHYDKLVEKQPCRGGLEVMLTVGFGSFSKEQLANAERSLREQVTRYHDRSNEYRIPTAVISSAVSKRAENNFPEAPHNHEATLSIERTDSLLNVHLTTDFSPLLYKHNLAKLYDVVFRRFPHMRIIDFMIMQAPSLESQERAYLSTKLIDERGCLKREVRHQLSLFEQHAFSWYNRMGVFLQRFVEKQDWSVTDYYPVSIDGLSGTRLEGSDTNLLLRNLTESAILTQQLSDQAKKELLGFRFLELYGV